MVLWKIWNEKNSCCLWESIDLLCKSIVEKRRLSFNGHLKQARLVKPKHGVFYERRLTIYNVKISHRIIQNTVHLMAFKLKNINMKVINSKDCLLIKLLMNSCYKWHNSCEGEVKLCLNLIEMPKKNFYKQKQHFWIRCKLCYIKDLN